MSVAFPGKKYQFKIFTRATPGSSLVILYEWLQSEIKNPLLQTSKHLPSPTISFVMEEVSVVISRHFKMTKAPKQVFARQI